MAVEVAVEVAVKVAVEVAVEVAVKVAVEVAVKVAAASSIKLLSTVAPLSVDNAPVDKFCSVLET